MQILEHPVVQALKQIVDENETQLNILPNDTMERASIWVEDNRMQIGAILETSTIETNDKTTVFIAIFAHEIGHMMTWNKERENRSAKSIWGSCNKYVLKSELRASAWAMRFLKQFDNIDKVLARQFLVKCYESYSDHYNKTMDNVFNEKRERINKK